MAAELGNAYVNIIPKAPGISKNIEDVLGGGAPGAEAAGKGFGKKLLGGLAKVGIAAAVGKTIKDAFEAGGNLQQSFGGLDTIYGEASAAAKEYAAQAAQAGISANSYAEQAVSFGAALKAAYGGDTTAAMEAANLAILDMADNAAKMGTPLESIQSAYQGFAKQNYTMLDNLKLGYGGTKTEMERLLADASKLSGVEYDISNLGDVYSAIHVIQDELGLAGVAAEEAKTTLTGSLASVKASWTNVMAALTTGEGLDTAMANLGESVKNAMSNIVPMAGNILRQLPQLLVDVFTELVPQIIPLAFDMIVNFGRAIKDSWPEIKQSFVNMWDGIKSSFKSIDWASLGRNIISGIVNGIKNAGAAIWNALKGKLGEAWANAKSFLGIGSPSRVFAQEVGAWIPPGIAMGIDETAPTINAAVQRAVDSSYSSLRMAEPAPVAGGADMAQLLAALRNLRVVADVNLEGDARGLFRAVRQQNAVRTKATNYNALAVGGTA